MIEGWIIIALALAYVSGLFVIAWFGDRWTAADSATGRPLIYALSIGAYCTSWTFFGSVGLAATTGYDFIPTYIGPIVFFVFGWQLINRIVRLAKTQNITSIADFLAARYGKSPSVAALVTLVAVAGALPYIALQLKAVSLSVETLLGSTSLWRLNLPFDTAFIVALALAAFAILFGTRHIDATEHQNGLMLAIATESIVKLAAFLAVGLSVFIGVFGSPANFVRSTLDNPDLRDIFAQGLNAAPWITVTLLSFFAVLLLPRQFHIIVVENKSDTEIKRARWLFPLYLLAINLFVVPIAAAGLATLPKGSFSPDTFVLALPLTAGDNILSMFAFIGGLSAATAMVIVESVAIAIMVCNGVIVPLLLGGAASAETASASARPDRRLVAHGLPILNIRRGAIFAMLMGSYVVYHVLGQGRGLVAIGLVSFAATAQLAPAFFGGLFWQRATARGALWGITAGIAVWGYTLVVPWFVEASILPRSLLTDGPYGVTALAPQSLFFLPLEPLSHGVFWSLLANCFAYVIGSLSRAPHLVEQTQAQVFALNATAQAAKAVETRAWSTSVTVQDVKATVGRYLGAERTERAFREHLSRRQTTPPADAPADVHLLRFSEHLLASAVGAASSRLILALMLRRSGAFGDSNLRLLDDVSEVLKQNEDLLQSAIDEVRHGLSVFDKEMRLQFCNRQFRELLAMPPELARSGTPLNRLLQTLAERGDFGPGSVQQQVSTRFMKLAITKETYQEVLNGGRRIVEIRTNPMPQGGIVTTLLDITERYESARALKEANLGLERRVSERTAELLEANTALAAAKSKADEANIDKTRFLTAASHDVMQPLNAARLYMSSLVERPLPAADAQLARNVDASLEAVEEILSTLLEIARLDSGRMAPHIAPISLGVLFEQLAIEFAPQAARRSLTLQIEPTDAWVTSDRRLLRRLLQNLISNGIKYTARGTVRLSAVRNSKSVAISVADTGPGIPAEQLASIFKEFQRLEQTASSVKGLGLGLSIVERIARTLNHPVAVRSTVGRGSTFTLEAPATEARPLDVPAPAELPQTFNVGGIVALCIDNEPAVLSGMETLLGGWGCKVLKASNVEEALRSTEKAGVVPDIILADYHLDSGTGLQAIATLKAALRRDIPSAIITAESSPEIQRDIRQHCDAVLRKPIKAAQLRAVITQLTRQRTAAE
jgi:Na+/proline symporter/signal transduction histidine kinase/CheY-like chemotaxis protein